MSTGKKLKAINDSQFADIGALKKAFDFSIEVEKYIDPLLLNQTPSEIDYTKTARAVGYGESSYDKSIMSPEELSSLNKHRHEEQPWYASLGSAVVQAGTTLVGQTMQGVGFMLDPEQMINIASRIPTTSKTATFRV